MSKIIEIVKNKIPDNLWLDKLTIENDVKIEGKSLDYQSIMQFLKNLNNPDKMEQSPLTNMSLETIEESEVNNATVYRFSIVGQPK